MKVHHLLLFILLASSCVKKEKPDSSVSQMPDSPDFRKAEYFNDSTNHKDSAFYYFNNVTENSKDSLLVAMAFAYMSMIQNEAGDYYGIQESALAGIQLLSFNRPEHLYCLASLYNMLGRSNVGLGEYDEAIRHYKTAMSYQPYEGYKNSYRNNIAVALREKGDYAAALKAFAEIQPAADESNTDKARRITNTASLRWKATRNFNPVPELQQALQIRKEAADKLGTTASYNHLADFYRENNRDSAFFYASAMYEESMETGNTEDRLDALRKLTSVAPVAEARRYFEAYELLNDSVQAARNAAKNQFAVIRFESEKNRAENLLLQEDNAQKKLQLFTQRIISVSIGLAALLITVLAIWWSRRKKHEQEQKAKALIKENQLKLSQKIHDTVANGLYRMMSEMEHNENIDKEKLLDRIEEMYERSRDISYDPADSTADPGDRIDKILTSFATDQTKVSVVGNQRDVWENVSSGVVKELEQVVQELAVNMKKHSGARHVVFHFSRSQDRIHLLYKDDGNGFKANFQKGNGLTSTENRIIKIGGETTFTPDTANGAEIKIVVPTNLK
ncbi:MAG: ATP-binding protein [Chitinophagaceae bacterium]|nr:MAG: ATP-binding protein [Chitinophagaceae bacterium]